MIAPLRFRWLPFVAAALALLSLPSAVLRAQEKPVTAEVASEKDMHKDEADKPAPHVGETHAAGTHDEHATHEHIGARGANAEPQEFKTDLAIYTFLVFAGLLAILSKFAWGPIVAGLEKREHHIAEQIAAAERAAQEGRLLLAEYDKKLAGAQDDVRAIIDEARRDAEHTQQEILAKARADAQAEKDRSLREIETATAQSLKQMAEQSANLAVELAGKIVQARLSPSDHQKLIQDTLIKFGQAASSNN